jgi:hypothetical protein
MLDAFIIEEIKRRERERTADDRPVAQLPVPEPAMPAQRDDRPGEGGGGGSGGVVIIDYAG